MLKREGEELCSSEMFSRTTALKTKQPPDRMSEGCLRLKLDETISIG
jgi:hypothetical protein